MHEQTDQRLEVESSAHHLRRLDEYGEGVVDRQSCWTNFGLIPWGVGGGGGTLNVSNKAVSATCTIDLINSEETTSHPQPQNRLITYFVSYLPIK